MTEENIIIINEVIADYFKANTKKDSVSVKEIMDPLVQKGVFKRDRKNGQPIRKVLRDLDHANQLDKIPAVHAERVQETVYWYIVREGATFTSPFDNNTLTKKQKSEINRKNSDEYYLLNLCDELLGKISSRQHTFKNLLGEEHSDGKTRTKLAIDAFYKDLSLVLELYRKQSDEEYHDANKTTNGITKAEKRAIYDQRKRAYMEDKGITLIHIDYNDFENVSKSKLARETEKDIEVLKGILKDFIK